MTLTPWHIIWSCPNCRRFIILSLGSSLNWKKHSLIQQPQTYDNAVTFAKRKHHFADIDSDTQPMDLLQEISKEVSLKHTGIKQEPYSAPVQDTHTNQEYINKTSPNFKRIYKLLRNQ